MVSDLAVGAGLAGMPGCNHLHVEQRIPAVAGSSRTAGFSVLDAIAAARDAQDRWARDWCGQLSFWCELHTLTEGGGAPPSVSVSKNPTERAEGGDDAHRAMVTGMSPSFPEANGVRALTANQCEAPSQESGRLRPDPYRVASDPDARHASTTAGAIRALPPMPESVLGSAPALGRVALPGMRPPVGAADGIQAPAGAEPSTQEKGR